jgi:glycerophosphoryl diester phosphodiesterase
VRWLGVSAFRRGAGRPPLVFGHRGVRGALPENTLAAFELATSEGADGIELDVRVAGDGTLIVLHDPTFARVTGETDTRDAASLPYTEIRRIDVGGGEPAPRLYDVMALARARGLRVNVEMKRDAPDRMAIVRATARVLSSFDPRVPVIVSSFDPAMLTALGALAPRLPRAFLVNRTWYARAGLRLARAFGGAVHIERTLTDPAALRGLRAQGLVVNVWTVNDAREAQDLAALGVDGLITDTPAAIRAAL